jgi:cold shock CspA family protein
MDRILTETVETSERGTSERRQKGTKWRRTTRATGPREPERGRQTTGEVVSIRYGQSHGFIRTEHSREVFFHRRDVADKRFNGLSCGDRVEFELIEDKLVGPRAVRVRPIDRHARTLDTAPEVDCRPARQPGPDPWYS